MQIQSVVVFFYFFFFWGRIGIGCIVCYRYFYSVQNVENIVTNKIT